MLEFSIPDISCGHCVGVVQKTVAAVDGNAKVEVDLATKRVRIESSLDRDTFTKALIEAGYTPASGV